MVHYFLYSSKLIVLIEEDVDLQILASLKRVCSVVEMSKRTKDKREKQRWTRWVDMRKSPERLIERKLTGIQWSWHSLFLAYMDTSTLLAFRLASHHFRDIVTMWVGEKELQFLHQHSPTNDADVFEAICKHVSKHIPRPSKIQNLLQSLQIHHYLCNVDLEYNHFAPTAESFEVSVFVHFSVYIRSHLIAVTVYDAFSDNYSVRGKQDDAVFKIEVIGYSKVHAKSFLWNVYKEITFDDHENEMEAFLKVPFKLSDIWDFILCIIFFAQEQPFETWTYETAKEVDLDFVIGKREDVSSMLNGLYSVSRETLGG